MRAKNFLAVSLIATSVRMFGIFFPAVIGLTPRNNVRLTRVVRSQKFRGKGLRETPLSGRKRGKNLRKYYWRISLGENALETSLNSIADHVFTRGVKKTDNKGLKREKNLFSENFYSKIFPKIPNFKLSAFWSLSKKGENKRYTTYVNVETGGDFMLTES